MFTREECLRRLRAQVAAGRPIVGGGAGIGLSAKCAEAGGIDLIIIYNSGRFRMAGRGSLSGMMPYGDANQIVMDMAREGLPLARKTPVLAGGFGPDPVPLMELFLRDVEAGGAGPPAPGGTGGMPPAATATQLSWDRAAGSPPAARTPPGLAGVGAPAPSPIGGLSRGAGRAPGRGPKPRGSRGVSGGGGTPSRAMSMTIWLASP